MPGVTPHQRGGIGGVGPASGLGNHFLLRLVEFVRIIDDGEHAKAARFRIVHELIDLREVIDSLFPLDAIPGDVHAEPSHIERLQRIHAGLMVEEMDVDPHLFRDGTVPVEQFTAANIGGGQRAACSNAEQEQRKLHSDFLNINS